MPSADGWEGVVTRLVAERGDALTRYAYLICGSRGRRGRPGAGCPGQDVRPAAQRLQASTSAEAYVRRAILNTYLDGGRRTQPGGARSPT